MDLEESQLIKDLTEKCRQQAELIESLQCCGNCGSCTNNTLEGSFCNVRGIKVRADSKCQVWEPGGDL